MALGHALLTNNQAIQSEEKTMKSILVLGAILVGSQAFASPVGCNTTIQVGVAAKLEALNRSHEVVGVPRTVVDERIFKNHGVYRVTAISGSALPSRSTWLVVVKRHRWGSCSIVNAVMDVDIQ